MSAPEGNDELGRQVDDSMRLFQRSQVGPTELIAGVKPTRVVAVLDGSPQDEATIESAIHLRDVYNTETVLLDESPPNASMITGDGETTNNELAVAAVNRISGSRPLPRREGEPFESILAAVSAVDPDLVIVPCPLGRSLESLGADSTGTVADMLLARCPKPILFMRRETAHLQQAVQDVQMLVGAESHMHLRAAGWVFGLIGEGGKLSLNLVIDREHFENIRAIVEALHPEDDLDVSEFSRAMTETHKKLHTAMQRTANERNLSYALRPQTAEVAPPHPLDDDSQNLLVMSLEAGDQFNAGFVRDRLRRSPHPVLVITDPNKVFAQVDQ
ncbi:MAG: universal stress protein [Planctomycetota bacterium]